MSVSNRDRIRKGLDQTKIGLAPFVERELKAKLGGYWIDDVTNRIRGIKINEDGTVHWDTQALFVAMTGNWQTVFKYVLGHVERSYVGELIEVRNGWAHEKPFQSDDVYRALDTMQRLLQAISAVEPAEELRNLRADLQRTVFNEEARNKTRYQQMNLDGTLQAGLKPWREVIAPHADVASGKYMQAEFAADLAQVYQNRGSEEYLDPNEFYRRTFITTGLREVLSGAMQRMSGTGGDPVLELQTNFGGGKTHSMLALYHLFSGVEPGSLEGIETVLADAGVNTAPKASRAVLVGTALSPGEAKTKSDGTVVRTIWGEMAWQLGGAEGYALVADSDKNGTAPGSDTLTNLFTTHSPCLILIDEWVAYARQLFDKIDLPAGTFDSQGSFAQSLTEAAKAAPKCLVVASIPQSRIEIGGDNGHKALEVLKNIFTRVAKPWRAATGDEGFEIVRRRLFEPLSGKEAFAHRDATIDAFTKMYRSGEKDFPRGCGEGGYRDEIRASYPIHPELFRRLYDDWSTLDKFQRTRGVLRLLAKVIHRLWESNDGGLLIMPASIPMDDHAVKSELTRYLADVWEPIISQDVDGPNSLPLKIDQEVTHLGRYSACRRVARALYIGTAPGAENATPGVGSELIRLACAQPGETVATFGDALRRVSERGQYIHQDGNRYWLSTRPNLNRTAEDRAAALMREPAELHAEVVKRLTENRTRGQFAGVHVCPQSTADVPDDATARLVILRPEHSHKRNYDDSPARKAAGDFLAKRSNTPRLNMNCLVFLAPDAKNLEDLLQATAQYLAWVSILKDRQSLNLDQFQLAQAESKEKEYDGTTDLRVVATWTHALVPHKEDAGGEIRWEESKISSGQGTLAERMGKRLIDNEQLLPQMGGVRLRLTLDRFLWKQRDHVTVGELAPWFATCLELPRVTGRATLEKAVLDGASMLLPDDTFATAEIFDADSGRYLGLRIGGGVNISITSNTCLVKIGVARKQEAEDAAKIPDPVVPSAGGGTPAVPGGGGSPGVPLDDTPGPVVALKVNHFTGSVALDGTRVGRDAGKIADEVLSHLVALPGATVSVTMEIEIKMPGGVESDTVRIVTENANSLKFSHYGFEED